jgi:hypothetical protein
MKRKKPSVPDAAVRLARAFLKKDDNCLDGLREHDFPDDESAHDDDLVERLYAEFSAEVDRVQAALSREYGPPDRTGTTKARGIPLNGVFRFAMWRVGGRRLFVAAHHEDRGVPVLLWLGTVVDGAA